MGWLLEDVNPQNKAESVMDRILDRLYGYNGTIEKPDGVSAQIWAMPKNALPFPWLSGTSAKEGKQVQPGELYFLHYFQSQGYGPTPNECVTTSVLMCMNILKDWIAASKKIPIESNKRIGEFAHELDHLGIRGWRYRFPTSSMLPGMMHPRQAVRALKDFSIELRKRFNKSFSVVLSSGHTVDDLIQRIQDGNLILLHGAWKEKFRSRNFHLALLGGMPHTMVLVGYDAKKGLWKLLNPGDPMPPSKDEQIKPKLHRITTKQLMNFWGRRFLFYPPRFSITTITLEN